MGAQRKGLELDSSRKRQAQNLDLELWSEYDSLLSYLTWETFLTLRGSTIYAGILIMVLHKYD